MICGKCGKLICVCSQSEPYPKGYVERNGILVPKDMPVYGKSSVQSQWEMYANMSAAEVWAEGSKDIVDNAGGSLSKHIQSKMAAKAKYAQAVSFSLSGPAEELVAYAHSTHAVERDAGGMKFVRGFRDDSIETKLADIGRKHRLTGKSQLLKTKSGRKYIVRREREI